MKEKTTQLLKSSVFLIIPIVMFIIMWYLLMPTTFVEKLTVFGVWILTSILLDSAYFLFVYSFLESNKENV